MGLLLLASLPCLLWTQGAENVSTVKAAGVQRVCVPPAEVEAWMAAGMAAVPLPAADLEAREALPAPGIRARAGRASPTRSPWIDASGWRIRRHPAGRFRYDVPAGKAALAAAEAYVYGADAALAALPADLSSLGRMHAFLASLPPSDLPEVADLGVVDDRSAMMGEVLNLLSRRNLLFRLVDQPSPQYRLNVKLGTPDFPAIEAADPSAFALKVRRRLSDDERSLRLFGSEVVIGRLTSGQGRARLHLLNYGGREIEGLRVRLRGTFGRGKALVFGHGELALEDHATAGGSTEFTVPRLGPYAAIDLAAAP